MTKLFTRDRLMIGINSFWEIEVKNIIIQYNKAVEQKNDKLMRGMILELLKLLDEKQPLKIRSSAAWAFAEISSTNKEILRAIVPTVIDLMNDQDTFIVTYAINTIDNLFSTFPDLMKPAILKSMKHLDSFDPNLRRVLFDFYFNVSKKYPNFLKENEDLIREIKYATKDLDKTVSTIARGIIETLKI